MNGLAAAFLAHRWQGLIGFWDFIASVAPAAAERSSSALRGGSRGFV